MKTALNTLTRLLDVLSRIALWIGGTGLVLMTAAVGWQVWGRFILNDSPSWTEPVSLLLMLWFILLVAAVGVRERFHLGLDLIRDIVPEIVRVCMDIASFVAVGCFGAAMAFYGLELVMGTWSATIPVLNIPEAVNYLPLTISGVLIVLFSVERTLHLLVERRSQAGSEALAQAHAQHSAIEQPAD
ncbi:TRAP transporter small permease [Azospirillum thermophilum]|uniref:TRAP transporter small permease protein n=1 Tax=Azospirillum thermophilum TaxID=2202148 RepID=A0A2S2CXW5_9PROT|nr:TRAP transporter small permease [Azospirillum thermophilum]AWK89364.1 TRAP transporter small permease [Azospirillum thermophilum]